MRFQIEEMHQQISQKAAKEAKIFPKQDLFLPLLSLRPSVQNLPGCHELH
jgi:hypothetical protein